MMNLFKKRKIFGKTILWWGGVFFAVFVLAGGLLIVGQGVAIAQGLQLDDPSFEYNPYGPGAPNLETPSVFGDTPYYDFSGGLDPSGSMLPNDPLYSSLFVDPTVAPETSVVAPPVGAASANPNDPPPSKWAILKWLDPTKWLPKLIELAGNFLLGTMALIAGLAGLFLNGAMDMTVNMKDILAAIPVVDVGWSTFRDIANMVFIFVLIYIAIKTILNIGETKKMLVDIIVTALLINFSLFFTKIIIDASNIVALAFYNKMQSEYEVGSLPWQKGPSYTMFKAVRLQTNYNFSANAAPSGTSGIDTALLGVTGTGDMLLETGALIAKILLGSVLLLVFAFVMAVGGFLLILRIVTLMFLMILSPLAFVARILPKTQSSWNKWLESLINNALFAPVYFALLYIVILTAKDGLTGYVGTFDAANVGVQAAFGVILNYVFMMILMAGTIFVAKSLGVHGSTAAMSWGKSASNWARNKVKQTGGYAVSKTVGAAARRLEEKAQGSKFANMWGMQRLRGLTTKPLSTAKIGGAASAVERKKGRKEELSEYEDAKNLGTVKALAADLRTAKADAPKAPGASASEAEKKEHRKRAEEHAENIKEKEGALQDAMVKVSGSGLANIAMKDFDAQMVKYMTSSQFQKVYDSDKKTPAERDELVNLRNQHINESFKQYRTAEQAANIAIQNNPELAAAFKASGGLGIFTKDESTLSEPEKFLKNTLKEYGADWSQEQQEQFNVAYNEVRGRSVKELGVLNKANKEAVELVAPSLNWGQIKDMRKSDDFTYEQREGKGTSLRDYKEAGELAGIDFVMGVDQSKSFEDRYKERNEINKVWQKAIQEGEDALSESEKRVYAKFKSYVEANGDLVQHGLDMIKSHQAGRSPEELANPSGMIRNNPLVAAHYGSGVVKPMMGKDNIHHKILMSQMLREYADGKLTEGNKGFLGKVLFDRDAKDFYGNWRELLEEMKLTVRHLAPADERRKRVEDLNVWADMGAEGKKRFDSSQNVKTVSVIETIPGYKKPSGGSTTGGATQGGTNNPPSGGAGGGGQGGGASGPGKIKPKGGPSGYGGGGTSPSGGGQPSGSGGTLPQAKGASVPLMITTQMETDLKTMGYSQENINGMTPQQAWDILNS